MSNITKRKKQWNQLDIKQYVNKNSDEPNNCISKILDFLRNNKCKFNESFDITMKLAINTNNFNLQTSVYLPHAIKKRNVIIFSDEEYETQKHGFIHGDVSNIKNKNIKVDRSNVYLTYVGYFKKLAPITKQLATKKCLPLKKANTIADKLEDLWDLAKKFQKGNQIVMRNNRSGYLSVSFGRCSMNNEHAIENLKTILDWVVNQQNCPIDFSKQVTISSTMSLHGFDIPSNIIKSLT